MDSVREVQMIQLETLRDVARFCDAAGLRYFLHCGSLLGCIRHEGFIPWDDDVDLAMPLADYRRFEKLVPGTMTEKYTMLSPASRNHHLRWIKVCRNGTTYCQKKDLAYDTHWGISIDIYPLIGISSHPRVEKLQQKMSFAARFLLAADIRIARGDGSRGLHQYLAYLPRKIRVSWARLLLRLCSFDPDRYTRCCTIDGAPLEGKFQRSDFAEAVPGKFEGEYFDIPAAYERLLRIMYWTPKVLPPPEKRCGHYAAGSFIADTHRDYRLYRKAYLQRNKTKRRECPA